MVRLAPVAGVPTKRPVLNMGDFEEKGLSFRGKPGREGEEKERDGSQPAG